LTILQGIINRLAANSGNAKTWSITLVAAILVLVLDKSYDTAVLLALLPVAILVFLDAYYLALERDFRSMHKSFVAALHKGTLSDKQVFVIVVPKGFKHKAKTIAKSLLSTSIWPFYLLLITAVLAAGCLGGGTGACLLPPLGWSGFPQ
jgi:uncharacterized membrane protein